MSLHIFPVHFKQDVRPEDNIVDMLISSNQCGIEDNDVIVVSQKIVSKQEGRVINLETVIPSELSIGIASAYDKDPKLVEVILTESKQIVRMEHGVIIVKTKHDFVCANAGVDQSNVDGNFVTLLPINPDSSAKVIQQEIRKKTGKRVAIIISDTFGRPFRLGQTDNAIGVAGIEPILNYEGKPDTFGKILNVTATAIVDELCSAAELVMEKTKKCPMAIIKNYNYVSKDYKISTLIRSETDDLLASGDAKDSLIELIQTIKDELELDGLYDLTGHNKSCKRQRRFVVDGANVDVNRVLSGEPEAFEIIKRDGKKEFVSIGVNCSLSHQNGESAFARNKALAYVTAEILESLGYGVEIKLISATWDGTRTVTVNKLYNIDQTNYYSENCISAIAKESDAPVDIRNISAVALTGYLRRHIFAIKHAVYGQAGGECIKS